MNAGNEPPIKEHDDPSAFLTAVEEADDRILQLLSVWREVRGDRPVPLRRDMDPVLFPQLLPMIAQYIWRTDIGDFECVLSGENLRSAWGYSLTGKVLIDIVNADEHEMVVNRWYSVIDRPCIIYGSVKKEGADYPDVSGERLYMPIASNDGTVDRILTLSLYSYVRSGNHNSPATLDRVYHINCQAL